MTEYTHFTRRSMLTGKISTMILPIDGPTFDECLHKWKNEGMLIQHAFPMLDFDEREFIKTGVTPDEWNDIHGDDDK